MKYKVLRANSDRTRCTENAFKWLETLVNEAIEEGWKPQGGVSVTEEDHSVSPGTANRFMIVAQAMVKED